MDPTLDSIMKLWLPLSHYFIFNEKSWQINITHQPSNVMLLIKNYYNLVLLPFSFTTRYFKVLETNCKHLINFIDSDIDTSNLVTCFDHIPIFEWYIMKNSSKKE